VSGRVLAVLTSIALLAVAVAPAEAKFRSYALVQPDATLKVAGRHVRLWGIWIPREGQHCNTRIVPPYCGTRAATALEDRIQEFVTCWPQYRDRHDYTVAVCRVGYGNFDDGLDLAAYLLRLGLAVATPDAPFEYHTLERIARRRGLGIWGFQADSIR